MKKSFLPSIYGGGIAMVVEVVSKGSCNFVEVRGEREGSARAT